jgi:hypothetical protein
VSALPQFTNYVEQPAPPPPSAAAWLREQVPEQRTPPEHAAPVKYVPLYFQSWQILPDYMLQRFQDACVTDYRAEVAALDKRIRPLTDAVRPEQVGELQHIQREGPYREARRDLVPEELEQLYVFEDRSAVTAFINRNRLRRLLLEARGALNAAFGEAAVKKLTLVEDDEGLRTLFCLILIPGDMRAARLALKSFDECWWLVRSGQAGGRLNFDFELI